MADDADIERALWSLRAYDTVVLATAGERGPHVAAFFFAPERTTNGVRLLIAMPRDSRKLRELTSEPRVGFMCFPGNATRWITGFGTACAVDDESGTTALRVRLPAHAPDSRAFIDAADVVAVEVTVTRLEVVEAIDTPVRIHEFDG
jgi:nitroimidazol reductase NimA-like FMN-containing flavoprotein (pyridoxamine 5'-phosphate oxidase superfamily)